MKIEEFLEEDLIVKLLDAGLFNDVLKISVDNLAIEDRMELYNTIVSDDAFSEYVTEIPVCFLQNHDVVKNITIPEKVKIIGDHAFSGCLDLENITLPDSLISIGDYAFAACHDLTSINIPKSVTSIGNSAFMYCMNLIKIVVPSSVTDIPSFTFHGCRKLTSAEIPDSVTSIGKNAFSRCYKLTEILFNGTTEQWGSIKKDRNWKFSTSEILIRCKDGYVTEKAE